MRTFKAKRLAVVILSSLLLLQQSFVIPAMASTITDGNGVLIDKNSQSGNYEIRPDAWNGKIGFKEFQDLNLSKGDILNFLFQWYQQEVSADGLTHTYKQGDIDTFINFVSNQININGIVNALSGLGGGLKSNGNLIFISPNGMVVGASGVLNVGSLSVFTPTMDSYNALKSGIPVADRNAQGFSLAQEITKEWDPSAIVMGNGLIQIDGKILARGDVNLHGGTIAMADGGAVFAGVGGNTDTFIDSTTAESAANTLFTALVNTDNMNLGNGFANASGNIVITSNVGTSVADGAKIRITVRQVIFQ